MLPHPDEMTRSPSSEATIDGASITVQRLVEWSDTDASTRWHYTAPLRMLEAAETALLDRLGLLDEIYARLPRVAVNARFMRPLRFRQKVDVDLQVAALGRTSITYRGSIREDREVAVNGELVAVLIDDSGRPVEWSEKQRNLLGSSGPQIPELLTDGE